MKYLAWLALLASCFAQNTRVGPSKLVGPSTIPQAGAGVTWTLVHDTYNDSATGTCGAGLTSCTTTIPAVTAGNVLIVGVADTINVGISSVTGDSTWTHCSNCSVFNNTGANILLDIAYVASATGGGTSIVTNFSTNVGTFVLVDISEWHRSSGTATFDTSNNVNDTTNCTACNGVPLTLTGASDLVYQAFSPQQTLGAINSPYALQALPSSFYIFWGAATTGTAPVVNQSPTGNMVFSAVAFK